MNSVDRSFFQLCLRRAREALANASSNVVKGLVNALYKEYKDVPGEILGKFGIIRLGESGLGDSEATGWVYYSVGPREVNGGGLDEKGSWGVYTRDTGDAEVTSSEGTQHKGVLAWVVGIMEGDKNGDLWVRDCRDVDTTSKIRLVVAPGPSPEMKDRVVWFKKWNFIGAKTDKVLEVELSQIVPVLADVTKMQTSKFMTLATLQDPTDRPKKGPVNLVGKIRSKSAVLARRSGRPNFLLELSEPGRGSTKERVALIVFDGDAVRWWPFLQVDKCIGISAVGLAMLPSMNSLRVLRATGNVNIVSVDICSIGVAGFGDKSNSEIRKGKDGGNVSNLRKGCRYENKEQHFKRRRRKRRVQQVIRRPSKCWSGCTGQGRGLVNYTGTISEVLQEGRLRLDDVITAHLGSYCGWCAGAKIGSVCMRQGACLRVTNASLGFRWGRIAALFPTARTSVEIMRLGDRSKLGDVDKNGPVEWRRSPWRIHWRQLNPHEVIWAEELYNALLRKFGDWVRRAADTRRRSTGDPIVEAFLGTGCSDGLVRHLMDTEGVTGFAGNEANATVYGSFLWTGKKVCRRICHGSYPHVLSIDDLSRAADALWLRLRGKSAKNCIMAEKPEFWADYRPSEWEYAVFSDEELANLVLRNAAPIPGDRRLLLIGILESARDFNGFYLSDSSGALRAVTTGKCAPEYVGAMIKSKEFAVVIERNLSGLLRKTLVLCSSNCSVLSNGPYSRSTSASMRKFGTLSSFLPNQLSLVKLHPEVEMSQAAFREPPLICVFVLRSSSSQAANGDHCLSVSGSLIAVREHGVNQPWTCLLRGKLKEGQCVGKDGNSEEPFLYSCEIIFSGVEALWVRPVVYPGCLYALSCNDLIDVRDLRSHFDRMASSPGGIVITVSGSVWMREIYEASMTFYDETDTNYSHTRGHALCKHHQQLALRPLGAESRSAGYSVNPCGRVSSIEDLVINAVADARKAFFAKISRGIGSALSQDNDVVSFTALVISRASKSHGNRRLADCGSSDHSTWLLKVCDLKLPLRSLEVVCSERVELPTAVLPGTSITIVDAFRKRSSSRKWYVLLTPCASVRVNSRPPSSSLSSYCSSSVCCQRPLPSREILKAETVRSMLYEVGNNCEMFSIQLNLVQILTVQLKRKSSAANRACTYCGSAAEPWWEVDAYAECKIDDGTELGWMACRGFRVVTEMLGATPEEALLIKRYIFENNSVFLKSRDPELEPSDEVMDTSEGDVTKLLRMMVLRAARPVEVFATSRPKLASDESFEIRAFGVGSGIKLFTTVRNSGFNVTLDCHAVVEDFEPSRKAEAVPDLKSIRSVPTKEAIKDLLSNLETVV